MNKYIKIFSLIFMMLLVSAAPSFAVVTRYINTASTAGGDGTTNDTTGDNRAYATMAEWEAAENTDLVTATETHVVNCSGVAADTTATTLAGWTTSSTYFLSIVGNAAGGRWNPAFYELDCATTALTNQVKFLYLTDLQIRAGVGNYHAFYHLAVTGGDKAYLSGCILVVNGTGGAVLQNTDSIAVQLDNCILYGNGTGTGLANAKGATVAWNCIIYNFNYGCLRNNESITIVNSAVFGNVDDFNGFGITITNCASPGGEGTNAQTLTTTNNYAAEFTDILHKDFTLVAGSVCIGNGVDDPGSGYYSDDILNFTRTSTWDIGAFDFHTVTRYVNTASTAGGDGTTNATTGATRAYASLSEWEAAEDTDLETATVNHLVHCSGTAADTTRVTVSGWTTTPTFNVIIKGDANTGLWDETAYRLEASDTDSYGILQLSNCDADVLNIQVHNTASSSNASCIFATGATAGTYNIGYCVLSSSDEGNGVIIYTASADLIVNVYNTLIFCPHTIGTNSEGIYASTDIIGEMHIYNCTIHNFDDGIERDSGTMTVDNSVVFGNVTDFDGTMTINNCASDDGTGTAPQTLVSTDSYASEFTDISTYDYSTLSSSVCMGNGITGVGGVIYNDDVRGNIRVSPWDIGAFKVLEVVRFINTASSAGGNGTTNATTGDNRAYATMPEWEAAENTNLVLPGVSHVVYCSGTADDTSTYFDIAGWITSADYKIIIRGDAETGIWDGDKYILGGSSDFYTLALSESNVNLENIQIVNTRSNDTTSWLLYIGGASTVTIKNSILSCPDRGDAVYFTTNSGAVFNMYNSVAFSNGSVISGNSFVTTAYFTGGTANFYNNTFYNFLTGFAVTVGTVNVTNCVMALCPTPQSGDTATLVNCATDTGVGSNPQTLDDTSDYAVEFTDAPNYDYTLVAGSVCIGNGTDDPGSGLYLDDIIGFTRTSTWDIGAFESQTSAVSPRYRPIMIY